MTIICLRKTLTILAALAATALAMPATASGESALELALGDAADYRYASALANFRRAAAAGNVQAQRSLGLMLLNGEALYGSEIGANRVEATKWLSLAAANGCGVSKLVLARLNTGREPPASLVSIQ
ncbi:MAG: hypothetical protein NDI67_02835 [Sulfuritalea sp.]|nr:hypothetical protein [Sulfuritalea sp.]